MHNLAHCCLQSVCCSPGTEEQLDALARELDKDLGLTATKTSEVTGNGRAVAEWIDANDMALVPKSLAVALNGIVKEALTLKYKPKKDEI
jgi:hypothetical protein